MTNLKYILKELQRTLTLVEGWSLKGEISAIERDLALDKLKALYEAVRFAEPAAEEVESEPLAAPVPPTSEPEKEPQAAPFAEELPEEELLEEEPAVVDFDELMLVEEVEDEPAPEPEPEPEPKPEPEPEPQPEPEQMIEEVAEKVEEVAEEVLETVKEAVQEVEETLQEIVEEVANEAPVVQNSLFDMSEIPVHRRSSRRVLMSLYNDTPAPKSEPEPEPEKAPESPLAEALQRELEPQAPASETHLEPEPMEEPQDEEAIFEEYAPVMEPVASATEPTPVLGEVIASEPTLAESLVEAAPMTSTLAPGGESLRKMIALNDRFLLRSELFADNDKAYEQAIEELDNMSSIDDCMIYIAENYAWNANSEAAKLLFELLERKYGL